MDYSKKAILQTLIYHDIFNFPLTKQELWHFLKSSNYVTKEAFEASLHELRTGIIHQHNFYALQDKASAIKQRKDRKHVAEKKLYRAQQFAKRLALIPTILFIGISGSLAMGNVTEKDDIDLFVIVKHNTIWSSRLAALLLLELYGVRRKKFLAKTANTICINMFLDESARTIPPDRYDIYTAQEVAQIQPLLNRQQAFEKFLAANTWITNFMPNIAIPSPQKARNGNEVSLQDKRPSFFEILCKRIQLSSIRKTQTIETVTDNLLAFHPRDYRRETIHQYRKKLRDRGILY